MRLNKILFAILVILLAAVFFKVRREYFTEEEESPAAMPTRTMPTTIAGLKAEAGATDEQFNEVLDIFASDVSSESTTNNNNARPTYPSDSPQAKLGLLIFGLMMAQSFGGNNPLLQELQTMMMARVNSAPPSTAPPSTATYTDPPTGPTPMPGSRFYAAINELITNNY